MSSSGPAAAATEPPGASQRSAPSGSCPHPKQRLYLSSISGQLRASGSGHPAACPDARVTVTPAERWAGEGGRQNRGGRHDGRAGGEGENAGAGLHPPVPPVVTHAAHRHDGSPVPGGPRPRASSRPHHSIPGGWANTGCKTHTAGTGGSAPGTHGCQQPPLADASRGGGGSIQLPPQFGGLTAGASAPRLWPSTRARGTRCRRLPLRRTGGSVTPPPTPNLRHPERGPEGLDAGSRHGPSKGQGDALGHTDPPKLPSPPSLGGLGRGLKDPACPQAQPRLGHPQPSCWRWHLTSSRVLGKGGAAFGRWDPEGCASLPDRHGLRASPAAHAALASVQHVCATLAPMQHWCPCNTGAHASRLCNAGAHATRLRHAGTRAMRC